MRNLLPVAIALVSWTSCSGTDSGPQPCGIGGMRNRNHPPRTS